jgi:glucose-1-phosphate adenylyltransferase
MLSTQNPTIVDIFAGDHVYFMDVTQLNDFHLERNADLSICAIPLRRERQQGNSGCLG